MGDVYEATGAGSTEHARICFGATVSALKHGIPQGRVLDTSKGSNDLDIFRSFKGDVETLLKAFPHKSLAFDNQTSDYYHPGKSARALMDGEPVAQFGQLHPQVAAGRKLRQEVFIAELFADRLYQRRLREILYQPLPRFPGVERDFSFLFDDGITFDKIQSAVRGLSLPELRDFSPAEIFRGGSVPFEQYSILLRATFQSLERTLREDEVADWSSKIVAALQRLGGAQRA
jgi:phenylalanyl-tRNA synthetase beta chain